MADLSQAELARRAGVTQSVISAYESGSRQPSLPTLARLVGATGAELQVRIALPPSAQKPAGPLGRAVHRHAEEIREVLSRHGLRNPRLFGSVARGTEGAESDIDLLVEVPAGVGLLTLGRCQAELQQLLGAPVDLVPADDLKRGLADEVLAETVPV